MEAVGAIVPAAAYIEDKIRLAVRTYKESAKQRRVRNLSESAKVIASHYNKSGWDCRVTGLDPVLLKDLNLDAARATPSGITNLAARLSDTSKVMDIVLDVKNHGEFVPVPGMFGGAQTKQVTSHEDLAILTRQELSKTTSDQTLRQLIATAIDFTKSRHKWFKHLGLGMVPLPVNDEYISSFAMEEGDFIGEEANGRIQHLQSTSGADSADLLFEKLVSLAYLLLACKVTKDALSEIHGSTGADHVYKFSEKRPKWRGENKSVLGSFKTATLAKKAMSFISNDLYDVILTLKHVRLRAIIKKTLIEKESDIQQEVQEYRSASGIALLRRLQQKTSGKGKAATKYDILSLVGRVDLHKRCDGYTGPIGCDPEGLNEFMLTNITKGENDGTTAGKIGRDLFCGIFSQDVDDFNPMKKINGYTARVLLCGQDVIVVEPVRKTLTIVRNDDEWTKDLAPSLQLLESNVRTPRIRLAAELLLCAVTGAEKKTYNFLKDMYSENKISYEPEEFKKVYMRGTLNGVKIKASQLLGVLEHCNDDQIEASVFRETLDMYARYSRGLKIVHEKGKGCYKEVLSECGVDGNKEELDLDVPVPLIGVTGNTGTDGQYDGYLFADEVVFDCALKRLKGGEKHMIAHITGSRSLKDRKGLTISWRVDANDVSAAQPK